MVLGGYDSSESVHQAVDTHTHLSNTMDKSDRRMVVAMVMKRKRRRKTKTKRMRKRKRMRKGKRKRKKRMRRLMVM